MEFKAEVCEGDTWARKDDPQKQVFLKYDHDNAKIVCDELFFPYLLFYIFLYLCALEISPLLILGKGVVY